jgi:hypothetical protein
MFEFNQHGATLDHNEIKHWLEFCLTLYIWAKKVTNEDWLMMMRFYENPGENGIETLLQGQSPEKDGIETFSQGQNPEQDGIETPSQEEQKPNDDHPDLCKFLHQIGVNPENAKYFLAKRDASALVVPFVLLGCGMVWRGSSPSPKVCILRRMETYFERSQWMNGPVRLKHGSVRIISRGR